MSELYSFNLSILENNPLAVDYYEPATFLTWFSNKNTVNFNINTVFNEYSNYLIAWGKRKNLDKAKQNNIVRDAYVQVLRDIVINYATEEERRFVTNADFNDEHDLDVVLPFFIQKIKQVCLYYVVKREELKSASTQHNLRGSNYGIEALIKKLIFDAADTNQYYYTFQTDFFPPVSALAEDISIYVEELFDTSTNYYNINPVSGENCFRQASSLRRTLSSTALNSIDSNLYNNFKQAIIEAIQQYPLFINSLGTNNFSINPILSGTELEYLKSRDFIDYLSGGPEKLKLNLQKVLAPKYVGSDFYYLSTGSTNTDYVSGLLFNATPPAGAPTLNLLNKNFPTVATVPDLSQLYTEYELGRFFVPAYLGLLIHNTPQKTFAINVDRLKTNTVYVFPDPEVVGNVSYNSLTDTSFYPLIYEIDVSWNKVSKSNQFIFGDVLSDSYKQLYYGYESQQQDLQKDIAGISKSMDNVQFWGGEKQQLWANPDLWPDFKATEFYNYQTRQDALMVGNMTLVKWSSDIFGNEYGLYKETASIESISTIPDENEFIFNTDTRVSPAPEVQNKTLYQTKKDIPGKLFFKNNFTTKIQSISGVLDAVFLKYPAHIYRELNNSIYRFSVYNDVIILETENYVVVEKFYFNFDTLSVLPSYVPGNYFYKNQYNKSIEQFVNEWYVEDERALYLCFLKIQPSLSGSNYKTVYPVIFKASINDLNFKEVYPGNTNKLFETYSLSANFIAPPQIDIRKVEGAHFSSNKKNNTLNLTYLAKNNNSIPIFVNEQFINTEPILTTTAPKAFKPFYFIYDNNYINPILPFGVKYNGPVGGIMGTHLQENYFDIGQLNPSITQNTYLFNDGLAPTQINSIGTYFIQFDWQSYNITTVFLGCSAFLIKNTNNSLVWNYGSQNALVLNQYNTQYKILSCNLIDSYGNLFSANIFLRRPTYPDPSILEVVIEKTIKENLVIVSETSQKTTLVWPATAITAGYTIAQMFSGSGFTIGVTTYNQPGSATFYNDAYTFVYNIDSDGPTFSAELSASFNNPGLLTFPLSVTIPLSSYFTPQQIINATLSAINTAVFSTSGIALSTFIYQLSATGSYNDILSTFNFDIVNTVPGTIDLIPVTGYGSYSSELSVYSLDIYRQADITPASYPSFNIVGGVKFNISYIPGHSTYITPVTGIICTNPLDIYNALTIHVAGSGSGYVYSDPLCISCGNYCSELLPVNTTLNLLASANRFSKFSVWVDGPCSGSSIPDCFINLTSNQTITAVFDLLPLYYVLVYNTAGKVLSLDGNITCPGNCMYTSYLADELVILSAVAPISGYHMLGFIGAPNDSIVNDNVCTFYITDNVTITARYVRVYDYNIGITLSATSGVLISNYGRVISLPAGINCGATCTALFSGTENGSFGGTPLILSANAIYGYTFKNWIGGPCDASTSNICNFTVENDVPNIVALYDLGYYNLVLQFNGTGHGLFYSDTLNLSYRNALTGIESQTFQVRNGETFTLYLSALPQSTISYITWPCPLTTGKSTFVPVISASKTLSTGITGASAIAVLGSTSGFILSGSKLLGFGQNSYGELGVGNTDIYTTLVLIPSSFNTLACGNYHTLALSGNTIYFAGDNTYYQSGQGLSATKYVNFTPLTGSWNAVTAGAYNTFALSGNTLFSVGLNNFGQAGIGNNINLTEFTPLTGNWNKVVAGYAHTVALSANTIFVTGDNSVGQLGLGTGTSSVNLFVPITGQWSDIDCGAFHTVALSANTKKWFVVGNNFLGQLGIGNTPNQFTFVPLSGEYEEVFCHGSSTFALSSQTAFATGLNNDGQLGLNDTDNKFTLTPVSGKWLHVALGDSISVAQSGSTLFFTGTYGPYPQSVVVESCSFTMTDDLSIETSLYSDTYVILTVEKCGTACGILSTSDSRILYNVVSNVNYTTNSIVTLNVLTLPMGCVFDRFEGEDIFFTYAAGPGISLSPTPVILKTGEFFSFIDNSLIVTNAAEGAYYAGGDGVTVSDASCTINMTKNRTISAFFA